ncbi:MAG: hypothetical protein AB1633_05360 [Elusimicrobiota bacterium]
MLDKRFKWQEKERIKNLKSLTTKKAEKLQKSLLLFSDAFKKNYKKDDPVSYELLLKNRK